MQVWKLDQYPSTNRWTLKHSLSFQSLFVGLNLTSPPSTYHIEACFHPDHKDVIFMRIGKNNVVYTSLPLQDRRYSSSTKIEGIHPRPRFSMVSYACTTLTLPGTWKGLLIRRNWKLKLTG